MPAPPFPKCGFSYDHQSAVFTRGPASARAGSMFGGGLTQP